MTGALGSVLTGVKWTVRAVQVVGFVLAVFLVGYPLFAGVNWFQGAAMTMVGLVFLVVVVALELLARGVARYAS